MAMAFGINAGGNMLNPSFRSINKSNQIFCSNPSPPINIQTKKVPQINHASVSNTPWDSAIVSPPDSNCKKDVNFSSNIDSWMQNSVTDIVKNLKQAPLLVQIYSEDGRMDVKMERALSKEWPFVRSEWENGKSKSPDGLIFVEELKVDEDSETVDQDCYSEKGVAKAWGIVVQGKGVECGPACYMLKTNRVCGGMGLGFCTHFCLMRVKNFRDSALEQFKDSWLLQ